MTESASSPEHPCPAARSALAVSHRLDGLLPVTSRTSPSARRPPPGCRSSRRSMVESHLPGLLHPGSLLGFITFHIPRRSRAAGADLLGRRLIRRLRDRLSTTYALRPASPRLAWPP